MPRVRLLVRGVVQGVGFRPFVYRLALVHGLSGWVRNRQDGVEIEVQGDPGSIEKFRGALHDERPAPARIHSIDAEDVPLLETEPDFQILKSGDGEAVRPTTVPPDLAICPECAAEMGTPGERRHRYPFTNCTHCGPRYSIIEGLPYDRPKTSMKGFPLCPDCQREYADVLDRRFHAQPLACPVCGPKLRLLASDGQRLSEASEALDQAVAALLRGEILALKGLGGFQLLVDATSEEAVARLRSRKRREEKPFAVMFPDLDNLRMDCEPTAAEEEFLSSPEAPILLLRKSGTSRLAANVAPRNPYLGAFLPNTPLHRLLLGDAARPLVCTSGNLSEEPMATEDADALERLGGVADCFLVHDRPVVRPVDDSVLRMDAHGPMFLRRARGFAPMAHPIAVDCPPILALGAHQKSTVCMLFQRHAVVSQHLGDLQSAESVDLLRRTVDDLLAFFDVRPEMLACDIHPDYASTRLAEELARTWNIPLVRVQHHHAHGAAVIGELGLDGPALALTWDGTGLGTDGTIWGGEALRIEGSTFTRLGHLKPFPLPGGDAAVRDPRRSALGLLWACFGDAALGETRRWFSDTELQLLTTMLSRGIQSPLTSSMGRLFDAVSALAGVRGQGGFEGQAAMELEWAADHLGDPYPWSWDGPVADPVPLVSALLEDLRQGASPVTISARFHGAAVKLALGFARRAGLPDVILCGGCFQNRLLLQGVREALLSEGFRVHIPKAFPPNDGAISLGQACVAAWSLASTWDPVPSSS
jgi:hydrogenase maturation protein HypF